MSDSRDIQLQAAVEAEAEALAIITTAVLKLIAQQWRQMSDPYNRSDVDTYVKAVGQAVVSARRHAAGISDTYMRAVLDIMAIPTTGKPLPVPDLPRGIPTSTEYARPVKVYRRARLEGLDELLAANRALARQETMATMDIALAARDGRMNRLATSGGVGYRRIVHPEVVAKRGHAPGPVCGLCLAASDRIYHLEELQPLHDYCRCTVMPVSESYDPGSALNRQDLKTVYAQAGGTDRQALAKQRYKVEQHAELGPVLVNATYNWRSPADVHLVAPGLVAQARVQLATVENDLAALLTREAAGEDVSAPIQWDMDRITALKELLGQN